MARKKGKKSKKIEEYEAGRINFENVLQDDLRQANQKYRSGNNQKFYLAIQTIWNNCMEADKEAIIELLKERNEDNENRKRTSILSHEDDQIDTRGDRRYGPLTEKQFKRMMNANPSYATGRNQFRDKKLNQWREAFELINEGLKRRYYGQKRQFEKDELEA